MKVEVRNGGGYLYVAVSMKVTDTYTGKANTDIECGFPLYCDGVSVRMVVNRIRQEIEFLWMHELHEWCKIGDEFLFGDPHG